jgi:hypothetical protein
MYASHQRNLQPRSKILQKEFPTPKSILLPKKGKEAEIFYGATR